MNYAKVIFACLTLIGCSDPMPPVDYRLERLRHETLTIDDTFTPERIEQVIDGIETWNAAAPEVVGLRYRVGQTTGAELEIVQVQPGFYPPEPRASGRCCFPAIEVVDCKAFSATVVHELGHFLGLPHADDPSSVMFWANRYNQVPTEADVSALRAIR